MSGQARVIKLAELGSAEDLKPLLRRCRLLLDFFLFAQSLLFLLLMLVSDLGLAFLEKHLTILILPEGGLALGAIFEAHTEVRQHIITELVAQHKELFGTLV